LPNDAEKVKQRQENKKRQREVNNFIIDFAKNHSKEKPMAITINTYGSNLLKTLQHAAGNLRP